jgi:hypothetical protein
MLFLFGIAVLYGFITLVILQDNSSADGYSDYLDQNSAAGSQPRF